MSGTTIISPNTSDTTLIQDNQAAGSITAADIRQINDSVSALPIASIRTSGYTYVATDHGTLVEYNSASPGTFTVPANIFLTSSVIGFRSISTGQLTIAAGAGLTLNVPATLGLTPVQWATGFIHFLSTTTAVMM